VVLSHPERSTTASRGYAHQIAEEHGRRLHEHFAQRDRRKLEREAAGAPHAALDGVGDLPEMRVAVRELGPGVADADDGTAVKDDVAESFRLESRAMHESVEVVPPEPVAASELVCCHVGLRGTDYRSRGSACGWPARLRS
jgi:hypothetical protein